MARKFKRGGLGLGQVFRGSSDRSDRSVHMSSVIVPVMEYLDVIPSDNVIHRYLFSSNSDIISFSINFVGLKSKSKVAVRITLPEVSGVEVVEFDVDEGVNRLLETREIPEGSTFELSLPNYLVSTHGKPKIWISYLFRITL